MVRPVGIETEYGLNCDGFTADVDFAFEASTIVRAAAVEPSFRGWDYTNEDARLDMRGKRVASLARDPNDLRDSNAQSTKLSGKELIADTVLPNGARFYNDHNHPEYCTDVCVSLEELVAQDKAGEALMLACQNARNASANQGHILVVKNNTDYHGRSYGTHENYLVSRSIPFGDLMAAIVPLLVARQVIVGAGKVGSEGASPGSVEFQISQRADFFEDVVGINTTARRPIFNTRDEPHADNLKHRRLHVIAGDANRSEYATALKAGMTGLVLDAVEEGEKFHLTLKDPVVAIQKISRNPDLEATVELEDGRSVSAIDVLESYLETLEKRGARDEEDRWVIGQWRELLDLLKRDPDSTANRLDWTAKRVLYREIESSRGPIGKSDRQRLDLAYHLVDPDMSLYDSLVEHGRMRRLVDDEAVVSAILNPPTGTRAAVRGALLKRFGSSIEAMEWDSVTLSAAGQELRLRLSEVEGTEIRRLESIVNAAESVEELLGMLGGGENA
ncbi:MAG: proteasome accessory factor PafA2 family protein [Gammaproteobacteria bacterium]|nr:proteasome accessory factor PafA2 family protein [Gammaproteobacteria bacterium]